MTSDAVTALAGAVARAVGTHDWRLLELEFRGGRRGPRGFEPDVGAQGHDAARARLDAWLDARYLGCENVVGRSVGELRETRGSGRAATIRKKRLADVDFPGGRLSLSLEAPTTDPVPPGGTTRRKCRHSYSVGAWRVDLTRVIQSADLDCDAAAYEVEVELADRDELFRVPLEETVAKGVAVLAALTSCG